jgi:uncharacterized membrane protein YfcA
MDGYIFTLFALAAFTGGFVSGFSGFAMGLVVSGVWLHIITPLQTATLIAGYGLLTQGYGILKLRRALDLKKAWPLVLGTIIGIPIGVSILAYVNPTYVRLGVGVLLVLYSVYSLTRPVFAPMIQWHAWRIDGSRRCNLDDLLPVARLAQGRTTRRVSAGVIYCLRGDLGIPSYCR